MGPVLVELFFRSEDCGVDVHMSHIPLLPVIRNVLDLRYWLSNSSRISVPTLIDDSLNLSHQTASHTFQPALCAALSHTLMRALHAQGASRLYPVRAAGAMMQRVSSPQP